MQAIFNELSFTPLANSETEAIQRINNFVYMFKELRNLGIRNLKVINEARFLAKDIAPNYKIRNWLDSNDREVDRDLKRAFAASLQSPNIPDSFGDDLLDNIEGASITIHNTSNVEGLLFACLSNNLCVSFSSETFWNSLYIEIHISYEDNNSKKVEVVHAGQTEHITSHQEWRTNAETHKTWILIQKTNEDDDRNPKYPKENNPLPYVEMSNLLAQNNADEDYDWQPFREFIVNLPTNERRQHIEAMAEKVALINQYHYDKKLSRKNSSKGKRRIIYKSNGTGNSILYLSVDLETGGFEVCNHRGKHLKEIYFDGQQTQGSQSNHNISV